MRSCQHKNKITYLGLKFENNVCISLNYFYLKILLHVLLHNLIFQFYKENTIYLIFTFNPKNIIFINEYWLIKLHNLVFRISNLQLKFKLALPDNFIFIFHYLEIPH